jgi:DNA-directed RNA polymerase specialized sigma24 family protein
MRPIAPPPPPLRAAPLTFSSLDGAPFQRLPAVEAEIAAALAQDPASWSSTSASLAPETLVHLCRVLQAREDPKDRTRRRLGELLLILERRVARVIQKHAQGFDETTTEEIAAEVSQLVLERILEPVPDRAGEFLEVRFAAAVLRWTLAAVAKRRRTRPKKSAVAAALKRDEEPLPHQVTTERAAVDGSTVPDPEAILLLAEDAPPTDFNVFRAIAAVRDPRHREAVVLHHLQGWPIQHKNPQIQTLCSRFGVSDRQIHKWIAVALDEMREVLGEMS